MNLTEEDIEYINNKYDFAELYLDNKSIIKSKRFDELEFYNYENGFFIIDDENKCDEFSNIFRTNAVTYGNKRLQLIIILNYLEYNKFINHLSTNSFINKFLETYFNEFKITKDDFKFKYDTHNNEIVIIKTILSIKLFRGDHVIIKTRVITDVNDINMKQVDLENIKYDDFIEPERTAEELNLTKFKIHDPKREDNIYKTSGHVNKISPDLLSYLLYLDEPIKLNVDIIEELERFRVKDKNNLIVIL